MSDLSPRSSLSAHQDASHLVAAGNSAKSAGDSLQGKPKRSPRPAGKRAYVTRSRVEAVQARLSHRQVSVLADVGRLGIVTGKQLQRLHYGSSLAAGRLARKQVGQLVHWQVLTRLGRIPRDGQPGTAGYVYAAGVVGQRLLDPGRARYFPRWSPRPSFLRHAVVVSELYVQLRGAEQTGAIELTSYDTEPVCWRSFFGPGGARSVLKPDALAIVGLTELEYRYFVEVDCGSEHRPQVAAKAKSYVRYFQSGREQAETGIFPFVIWVAPNQTRATFLVDVLSSMPAEHWRLFVVTTAERAQSMMANGSPTSINNQKEVT